MPPRRSVVCVLALLALPAALKALDPPASPAAPSAIKLSSAERAAVFRAAGFKLAGGKWQSCGDPGTMSYSPGTIDWVRDINGDGLPEALVTEGSTYCFGNTGTGFSLVGKTRAGPWRLIHQSPGMADLLATRGAGNWPDLQVGGPGFCFSVLRWNGRAYVHHRFEYQGKRCRPNR